MVLVYFLQHKIATKQGSPNKKGQLSTIDTKYVNNALTTTQDSWIVKFSRYPTLKPKFKTTIVTNIDTIATEVNKLVVPNPFAISRSLLPGLSSYDVSDTLLAFYRLLGSKTSSNTIKQLYRKINYP